MSDSENIDTDLFATREEAVQAAIDSSQEGDNIVICRGEWASCPAGRMESCEFCARIPWAPGLTASDALSRAKTC